ncbi:hypothetical protein [Ruegeria hyattellae]|uniref:hypothetical protein n=1 Tax=Ruegeria hyattellae TaxID=3233337 RepID=UPI00355BCD93
MGQPFAGAFSRPQIDHLQGKHQTCNPCPATAKKDGQGSSFLKKPDSGRSLVKLNGQFAAQVRKFRWF